MLGPPQAHTIARTGKNNPFVQNIRGVLTLSRHSAEHPGYELEEFMLLIVEDDFPDLSTFQMAMFRAGWLPVLNLETSREPWVDPQSFPCSLPECLLSV